MAPTAPGHPGGVPSRRRQKQKHKATLNMAKSTRASAGKAKKAGATSAKARKSKSPAKKAAGGGIVSIEACKQVSDVDDVMLRSWLI